MRFPDPGQAAVGPLHRVQGRGDCLEIGGGRLVVWWAEEPVDSGRENACPARLPEWSSSSLPHPMQSTLRLAPEHFRRAGMVSTRPGQDTLVAACTCAARCFGLLVVVDADSAV